MVDEWWNIEYDWEVAKHWTFEVKITLKDIVKYDCGKWVIRHCGKEYLVDEEWDRMKNDCVTSGEALL